MMTFLHEHPKVYLGQPSKCRRLIESVLWIMRSGAQGRWLAKRYGNGHSVYQRFDRGAERGVWQAMCQHFADAPDRAHRLRDGRVVGAHAGALRKREVKRRTPWVASYT